MSNTPDIYDSFVHTITPAEYNHAPIRLYNYLQHMHCSVDNYVGILCLYCV